MFIELHGKHYGTPILVSTEWISAIEDNPSGGAMVNHDGGDSTFVRESYEELKARLSDLGLIWKE